MAAGAIEIGVFALDQILSPKPGAGKGWLATLAKGWPDLQPGAVATPVFVTHAAAGLILATAVGPQEVGTPVTLEQVPGLALFLMRLAGKPYGIASPAALVQGRPPGDLAYPAQPGALAAFVAGTLIDTPEGPRPAEVLRPGDLVTTLSNGSRPLDWVARRRVTPLELLAIPGLRPVALPSGSAGNDRALWLSPRQRLLIDDWRAEVFFGEDRVLAAAEALADDAAKALPAWPPGGVEYVLLLCDRHEILVAEGALCESYHPGEAGLAALTGDERASLAAVIPEADLVRRRAAFPIVGGPEARALRLPG